jgi:glycosyltransferase involved in cell wall biosynthesis
MKFALIASHPNLSTGYGKIASSICNELVEKHDVIYLGFQNFNNFDIHRTINDKIRVYDLYKLDPDSSGGFGDKAIVPILKEENPDIVIIYNDHGVCSAVLKIITEINCKKWCYLDLVYEYQYSENIHFIRDNCDKILTFTNSWKNHLNNIYDIPLQKMYTLYHGVTQVPTTLTKQKLGFKEDDLVILSLNRNDSRKNLDIVILSFLIYFKTCQFKDSLYLFINCHLNAGIKINEYLKIMCKSLELDYLQVQQHIRVPQNIGFVTDEYINSLYKCCDVGISITSGEGFGLTVIEHLLYKKPVICSRIPVFEELLGKDYPFFIDPVASGYSYEDLGGIKKYFSVQDCVKMLNKVCFMNYDITIKNKYSWKTLINDLLINNV